MKQKWKHNQRQQIRQTNSGQSWDHYDVRCTPNGGTFFWKADSCTNQLFYTTKWSVCEKHVCDAFQLLSTHHFGFLMINQMDSAVKNKQKQRNKKNPTQKQILFT